MPWITAIRECKVISAVNLGPNEYDLNNVYLWNRYMVNVLKSVAYFYSKQFLLADYLAFSFIFDPWFMWLFSRLFIISNKIRSLNVSEINCTGCGCQTETPTTIILKNWYVLDSIILSKSTPTSLSGLKMKKK